MYNLKSFKILYYLILLLIISMPSCAFGQGESMKSLFEGAESLVENKTITNGYLMFYSEMKGKKRKFLNCTFRSCRWKQADLDNIDFENCIFKDNNFNNSDFSNSNFIKTKFINCIFDNFTWFNGTFQKISFKNSKMKRVKFDGVAGDHVSFHDSKGGFSFIGKDFNVVVISDCNGGIGLRGTIKNINISHLTGNGIGLSGTLTNIVIESCEKLDELNLIEGKITDLQIHNIDKIGEFHIEDSTLTTTNSEKPSTITNCPMDALVIKDSKINDLTFNHCSVDNYFVLKNTEFKNLKLKNMSYVKNIDGTDLGGVQYDSTSDHFPPATEKR